MNEPTRQYASESRRWWRHERGSAAVEWAALAMVIATLFVMVAVGLRARGQGIGQSIGDVILQAINGQSGAANVAQPNVGAPNVGQPNVGAIGSVTAPVVGIPSAFAPPQNTAPAPAESEDSGSGWLDGIQLALDGIGLIPVVGEVADLVNGGISAARGDWVGAGLSLAAMIPIGGQAATGAKWVRTGLEYSDEAAAALRGSDEAAAAVRSGDEVAAGADDVARRTDPCPLGAGFGPILIGRAPTAALVSLPRWAIHVAMPQAQPCFKADGTFTDANLESQYQDYLARKQRAGEPARDRADWLETRNFFEEATGRGNRFNETRRDYYDYNEVHLENGKRLDSYDPDAGEIISRKATDFDNVQEETFREYLRELKTKYPPGTKIRSDKYPDLDGKELQGKLILEVPDSNLTAQNRVLFEGIAKKEGIVIRYVPE